MQEIHVVKVAPYSFMTPRALMMQAVVTCARSLKIVGFPDIYDVSIAKKSKVKGKFSCVSFGEFFFNFAHFEILTLPFTYYFSEKILSEQYSSMVKNKKSSDIGESI